MASRRDELNAYTFAKRRTLASFLQPSPSGSEEGAPKPLRAVLPGVIVGIVVLAVFGAWGMFKPTAPPNWDDLHKNVIVASKSTTRYVVLKTKGKVQLHPVLNMASAKLLVDPSDNPPVTVSEDVLDSGKIPHGVTIGIPYAPDRLPAASEAGSAKRWAVCERPGAGGRAIQKAAFVLAKRDLAKTEGRDKLRGGDLMYVVGPDTAKTEYVVDASGTAYRIAKQTTKENQQKLLTALDIAAGNQEPQRVSRDWLDTLHKGMPITFPTLEGHPGDSANANSTLDDSANRVGMVLKTPDQYYVVLPGKVAPVSDFTAHLLLGSPDLVGLGQAGEATKVSPGAVVASQSFGPANWPTYTPKTVNEASTAAGSRNTVCNVLNKVNSDNGRTTLSTWAGKNFPAPLPVGSSSAYVTAGSGQLYRQFTGTETKVGPVFLVTDTGLRYAMQSNSDSGADDSGIGTTPKERKAQREAAGQAVTRLGYENVDQAPIPLAWSQFLPTGPRLSTTAARQPQGS
ncbi:MULTISPECIES: type VII secretion protein EccB [unclassified Streptomyces]|uniref:Type VII secretion protein EccB n=1 Tax=Streptomyces sp. NBC_00119 TaxID=2975659 RepID=A0AAU1U490_9ACTN|nr:MULTISPECIES: type VII secretion protein EccB [unclassified Streptomyces]MCX4642803.1 type VII secretion protein EccB [Streptomyces sp. NBC_01446]MCX5323928.1 type VII secretion protein EccB [Streptomyces sp. NBC_00120]